MEISNSEASYCNFDILALMIFYPKYDADKFRPQDSVVYKIKERTTNEEFWFAIRSCPLPPGF